MSMPRRGFRLILTTALASILVLAACSDATEEGGEGAEPDSGADPGTADVEESADSLLPAAEGVVEYPLTLNTAWGQSVLQERPERIAFTSGRAVDTEILAALGGTPVLSTFAIDNAAWTTEALPQEIETVYDPNDDPTPLETIAATQPDLIVALDLDLSDSYDQLATIAPVLGAATPEEAVPEHWREDAEAIGQALDLTGAVDQLIADHQATFDQVRADYSEFEGLTASYVMNYGSGNGLAYFTVPGSDDEQFFLDLGFVSNPHAGEFVGEDWVSNEMLHLIDADVLVFVNSSAHGAEASEITDQQLYQNLQAVQDEHVVLLDNTGESFIHEGTEHDGNLAWALARPGPLGQQWAAQTLAPILADALR